MKSIRWPGWLLQTKEFLLDILGLKVSAAEMSRRLADPYNIFDEPQASQKALRVAAILAILFHLVLFLIVFPSSRVIFPIESTQLIILKNLSRPSALMGGGDKPKTAPPKVETTAPKPKARPVPIPDPTPDDPEPLIVEPDPTPEIVDKISTVINLGDVTAPPGAGGVGASGMGGRGTGSGPLSGPGSGMGDGGPYRVGGGVREPVLIFKTLPSYTEEARKNRVEGIVLLQVVVRANGSVDNAQIIRGLGFGLDDSALKEVVTKWKFKPGTLDGRPVDVMALIEVSFRLL